MKSLVGIFTKQLEEAMDIGANASLHTSNKKIANVVITGLGGSGIGGKIVSQLVADNCIVPITINNTYDLPGFVNDNTLVIASSFSGNTEETLYAVEAAQKKGAEIAMITSGGKFLELAKANNYNHIVLPKGDSPRAMLTYSLTQQFFLLNHYGLISDEFKNEIPTAISLLDNTIESIKTEAKSVAAKLKDRTTVIYSEAKYEGVAIRFRQQLNENAKVLCWHHALPEMNHNELVGWAGGKNEYAVVIFRSEDDFFRTQRRMEITKEVASTKTDTYIEIHSKGTSRIQRSLYLILMGDWISVYLAELNQVDPIEVNVIAHLKSELSKI
jgi:glucose/mannose-6-phosphate isomerase